MKHRQWRGLKNLHNIQKETSQTADDDDGRQFINRSTPRLLLPINDLLFPIHRQIVMDVWAFNNYFVAAPRLLI